MLKLQEVIEKQQDVFNVVSQRNQKIKLPCIAFIGEQSAGKSSVIQSIIGHYFLPTGNSIVTRRPLVIQLVNSPGNSMKAELLDCYLEEKRESYQKKFTRWGEIRKAIQFCTEKACPGKIISYDPLRLRIHSPDVINLTLIDLPGITKCPVGNQPRNIEYIIKKMISDYISKENCFIVTVCSGNVDIASSEMIKMAKEVDPHGKRSIAVLTKLDIMDKGTDAFDILTGRILPLRFGYIGVVNRSQRDIKRNIPIREVLQSEKRFFNSHPKYKTIASRQGIPFLNTRLCNILLEYVKKIIPALREKIDNLLCHARERLLKYGEPIIEEKEEGTKKGLITSDSYMLQLITNFSTGYVDCIEGRNVSEDAQEIFGGARINFIFFKKYIPSLSILDPNKTSENKLTDFDISLRIQNSKGVRSTTTSLCCIPETAFESLVKSQVRSLEIPSLHCCDLVLHELDYIIDMNLKPIARFPDLRGRVKDYSRTLLRQYMKPLKDHIRDILECELSFINTNHPDFFGGGTEVLLLLEKIKNNQRKKGGNKNIPPMSLSSKMILEDREKMEVEVIRALLEKYFEIIRVKVSDQVTKAIIYFLVGKSCKNLKAELIRRLYTDTERKRVGLLKENEDIKQKREKTKKMVSILLKAKEILNEVNDINIM